MKGKYPVRFPESALPQLYSDSLHAGVILLVVIAATILRAIGELDTNTVGNVFTAAIGYAAGRAGSVAHREFSVRRGEVTREKGSVSDTSG